MKSHMMTDDMSYYYAYAYPKYESVIVKFRRDLDKTQLSKHQALLKKAGDKTGTKLVLTANNMLKTPWKKLKGTFMNCGKI